MTSVEFHDTGGKLSAALLEVTASLPAETVSLRELLRLIGEQGLLLVCALLSLPFLIPVSIPGVSTVFGLAIILIGIGVTLNRVPWLPRRILDRPLATAPLRQAFRAQARMVARFERFIRPRLTVLTASAALNVVHGLALVLAGVLLMFPLGLVPFSNTLPGIAILLLSLGILERDGVFIVAGHLMNVATIIYFGALALGAYKAGQGLLDFLWQVMPG
jgi:hypothetical protein